MHSAILHYLKKIQFFVAANIVPIRTIISVMFIVARMDLDAIAYCETEELLGRFVIVDDTKASASAPRAAVTAVVPRITPPTRVVVEPELVEAFQNVIDPDLILRERSPLDAQKMFDSTIKK